MRTLISFHDLTSLCLLFPHTAFIFVCNLFLTRVLLLEMCVYVFFYLEFVDTCWKRMNFTPLELAVAAVFKRIDIIHKIWEESPGGDVTYKKEEKKNVT